MGDNALYNSSTICRVFDFKYNRMHLTQIIVIIVWVVYGQYIVNVLTNEIEVRC